MEHYWVWAVLLLMLGMGLAVLEVFFPSAGILGFLAISSILAAVFLGFQQGSATGLAILTVALVGMPGVIVLALKYWPKTAMGRRVLLMAPKSEDVLPHDARTERLKELVGQVAETECRMLPAGAIRIDGRTVDAISEGMPIEPGERVRIVEVRANRVIVRPLDEEIPDETASDPLMRPFEDPFEEPPA